MLKMLKNNNIKVYGFIIFIIIIFISLNYFGFDHHSLTRKAEIISSGDIRYLRSIIPNEIADFLLDNDSLNICLSLLKNFDYRSKDSIVYDTVNKGNYKKYCFEWEQSAKKWLMIKRQRFQKDKNNLFSVRIDEDYFAENNNWIIAHYDSTYYDSNGNYIGQVSSAGTSEWYEWSTDGLIETRTITNSVSGKTRIILKKEKNGRKLIKEEHLNGYMDRNELKWELEEEIDYSYVSSEKHTRIFKVKPGSHELEYKSHIIVTQLNDSLLIKNEYTIDSSGFEILCDSSITFEYNNKSRLSKSLTFEDHSVASEYYNKIFYDNDSNAYIYSKQIYFNKKYRDISFMIFDSLERLKYSNHYFYNGDDIQSIIKFNFIQAHRFIETEFVYRSQSKGIGWKKEMITVEFRPDKFHSYKTVIYQGVNSKCFNVLQIELKTLDINGNEVKSIMIK